jgi:hypothetical protein
MELQLEISANSVDHTCVYFFIDNENCGCLYLKKKDLKELLDGFKKLGHKIEVKEE